MTQELVSIAGLIDIPPPREPDSPSGSFIAAGDAARAAIRQRDRRAIRVLLIAESCGGGAGRHVLDLAEGLIARGCEVHLIDSPVRADRFFRERAARLRNLGRAGLEMRRGIHASDLGVLKRVRRYLDRNGPFDVIHGHGSKGGAMARLAGLGSSTPVLYTPHGLVVMDPGLSLKKRLFYRAIEWMLSRLSDRIITVSPEERRFCVKHGLGRSRVVMIPNGIGPIDFPSRDAARRELGIAEDCVVAGFVGRLVDQKAPDVLIAAFACVARSLPECRLLIVGAGPLEEALRRQANLLGINDRLIWLGERDAIPILPALDLFVLSSRKEGLPYVVLEALAAGLPILATESSGVEVLVRPGRNGVVVPASRPDLFATALEALLSEPRRLERLGRASLERASQFTVDVMVDRTLSEYLRCMKTTRHMQLWSTSRPSSVIRT